MNLYIFMRASRFQLLRVNREIIKLNKKIEKEKMVKMR